MDSWTIPNLSLPSLIVDHLLRLRNERDPPDHFVVRDEVFGLALVYERTVSRNEAGDILVYHYALYTDAWVIERHHMCDAKFDMDFEWIGRGDKEKWREDATILKLVLNQ